MTIENTAPARSANKTSLTNITIKFNGDIVEELKNVGPNDCRDELKAALLGAMLGAQVELIVSNPSVYNIFSATSEVPNLTITLGAAA